ncbi:hypothetical protein SynRS9915_00160 [Synechococcus sp. RS9915]|nr:hypothetical protein SynRS9915_00160 [Synechococcus sp. RS9915]
MAFSGLVQAIAFFPTEVTWNKLHAAKTLAITDFYFKQRTLKLYFEQRGWRDSNPRPTV